MINLQKAIILDIDTAEKILAACGFHDKDDYMYIVHELHKRKFPGAFMASDLSEPVAKLKSMVREIKENIDAINNI
jgi:hypothetical protein